MAKPRQWCKWCCDRLYSVGEPRQLLLCPDCGPQYPRLYAMFCAKEGPPL